MLDEFRKNALCANADERCFVAGAVQVDFSTMDTKMYGPLAVITINDRASKSQVNLMFDEQDKRLVRVESTGDESLGYRAYKDFDHSPSTVPTHLHQRSTDVRSSYWHNMFLDDKEMIVEDEYHPNTPPKTTFWEFPDEALWMSAVNNGLDLVDDTTLSIDLRADKKAMSECLAANIGKIFPTVPRL